MQWYQLPAAGIGIVLGSSVLAGDGDHAPNNVIDELRAEVAELKDTVAELKAASGDNWLTERRAQEIRGLVEDVLADADTRASLLQDGMTAGWDKNFYLGSADGNWRMNFSGQLQVRWALNNASGQGAATPNAFPGTLYGMEVRRAKLKFAGHVIDPSWQYTLQLAVDHDTASDGEFEVEDAIIGKAFDNGILLWVGQFKLEFSREELTSSTRQLAVDRSVINEFFNLDRSQGVRIQYTGDQFRLAGVYSDGATNRWGGFDLGSGPPATAFTGRVDWLAAGDWGQFKDFQGWRGGTFGAMIGAAIHYQKSKYGALNAMGVFSNPRTERFTWTIDTQLEGDGWNLFAYVLGNHLSDDAAGSATADQLAFVVQGGYMLSDKWDVFARYEWGDLDNNTSPSEIATATGLTDISIITIGTNYYVLKHTAKWTTDIGVGLDPVPTPRGLGVDWRPDVVPNDGQFVFRTQFQLLF